jgi:WhiB family transcriptional regulator, redox-sensing transcriptional regulator
MTGPLDITEWVDKALCKSYDPNIFFPTDLAGFNRAVVICAQCPVRVQCGQWAIEHPEEQGVWGGLSERERKRIRRRRRISEYVPS